MGTIVQRKKRDGSVSYTAQIRIRKGALSHTESKTSSDKRFLDRWIAFREHELMQPGALVQVSHAGTTMAQILDWYDQDFDGATKFGRSKLSTIKFLRGQPAFAGLDAVALTAADLIAYARGRRAGGTGPSTVYTDFIWLRSAMRAARLTRNIPVNVQALEDAIQLLRLERVIGKCKKRDRRPTLEELDALLSHFERSDARRGSTVKMRDLVLFALFSGRRQEEVCTICWDDIDERRKGVLVRDMKHPRDKIDTFCFFTDEAWSVLQRVPRTDARIFPYDSKTVSNRFTKACKFLAINDLRFHDLRHECVSWLFELGWDIPRVSNVSGHRSWSSLQRYTHLKEHKPHNKYKGWRWLAVD